MGISGLLPLLKSIQRPTELKKYAGETLAVDAYGWLHRGAISCALELAQGRPTRKYVDSVLHRVRMVQHFGVTPYLVFDGDFLPSKAATEASRARRREASRRAGQELLQAGNPKQAYLEFQKAIDVTPDMARVLIEELKALGLPYIVAPYEADAQMVYLERIGLVSGILSEDSDLLVFGAKRLLTKLDMQGRCIEINRREFCACREIALTDWTDAEFRQMAILSGCDYLDSIGNIGLKTAYRLLRKHKTIDRVVRMLQFDGKFKVSENYLAAFRQAELTFLHQRVFCPRAQKLVLLTEPADGLDVDEMRFIGDKIDHDVARRVACGDLHPMTKEPIVLPLSPGKKRRASSNARPGDAAVPFSPAVRGQNPPSLAKPIHAYFGRRDTAQRIPLGAMDTNCFAVDPQQVAALTQNGLAPRVFPLPRPYVNGGRTSLPTSTSQLRTADSPRPVSSVAAETPRLRRRQTEPLASLLQLDRSPSLATTPTSRRKLSSALPSSRPVSATVFQPPQKKARLGHTETAPETASPPAKALERSKYFSAANTDDHDHDARTSLMSDDSVEEAMLSLPDLDGWDTPLLRSGKVARSVVRVFEDSPVKDASGAVPTSDGIEVPASPCGKAEGASLTTGATPASRLSLERFSYAGGAPTMHGCPTPESSFVGRAPGSALANKLDASKPDVPTPPSTSRRPTLKSSRMSLGELVEATSPVRHTTTRKNRRSMPALSPVQLSFAPRTPAAQQRTDGASFDRVQGSEDQIVPDSDGDDEEAPAEQTGTTGTLNARFDLSRFLCA